ncbi:hypothetical protein E2562_025703 [Oryza meyeriana var. granulata]|uniref:Uncharacterized protein n=1 Tax=Oryza meyeriana var. granulata TaxID=110450 RepID=A0A6G1FCG1_9ORYZ|nr:hypothetical protein E2562_025703 [Oryza meyeriana var. granulata]
MNSAERTPKIAVNIEKNDHCQVALSPHVLVQGAHGTSNSFPIDNIMKTPTATTSAIKEIIDPVSPDVSVLSGESYDRKCIDACIQAENIYKKKRSTGDNVNFVRNPISSEVGPFYMTPTDAMQPLDVNVMHQVNNKGAGGSSTCKMPRHGKRRQIMGSKFTTHPYVNGSNKFFVSRIDKAYYDAVISMSRGQHNR